MTAESGYEICLIVAETDAGRADECLEYAKKLLVPTGMTVTFLRVPSTDGIASAFLKGHSQSHASYKIYMRDDVKITGREFLIEVVRAFDMDEKLGIIGVMGLDSPGYESEPWRASYVGAASYGNEIYFNERDREKASEVSTLDGAVLATRYDVPPRGGLFICSSFFGASFCLEYRRRGYRVAVLPQRSVWCEIGGTKKSSDADYEIDRRTFFAEYGEEISGGLHAALPGHFYHPGIEFSFDRWRRLVAQHLFYGEYEAACSVISQAATTFYTYNQFMTDPSLESHLTSICRALPYLFGDLSPDYEPDEETVLFHDAFGVDIRGLARIYLRALGELKKKIVYVVPASARGRIPTVLRVLEGAKVSPEIIYLSGRGFLSDFRELYEVIKTRRPRHGFLYTTPWDVSGILAFMYFEGKMRRYQVNLTGHAFWLGLNAFDFSLENDEHFSSSLSYKYRRIPIEKLLPAPFYPAVDETLSFRGFPFEKKQGDFVLFSGGNLYKTHDASGTYYAILDWCLSSFPKVKFWYAGFGDDSGLKKLMAKFSGRVFYTPERDDLFQALENVDMYLNTYPLGGGLMMQYSALAGLPPWSLLKPGDEESYVLKDMKKLAFSFHTVGELKKAMRRYITDEKYRLEFRKKMRRAVVTPEEFRENLALIMEESRSNVSLKLYDIDLTELEKDYYDRFLKQQGIEGRIS